MNVSELKELIQFNKRYPSKTTGYRNDQQAALAKRGRIHGGRLLWTHGEGM